MLVMYVWWLFFYRGEVIFLDLHIDLLCLKCISQLIPLSELTPEYKTVTGYVKSEGLLDRTIVSVSRIQNLDLWEMFCR